MLRKGLEPSHLAAPDPESGVSDHLTAGAACSRVRPAATGSCALAEGLEVSRVGVVLDSGPDV